MTLQITSSKTASIKRLWLWSIHK